MRTEANIFGRVTMKSVFLLLCLLILATPARSGELLVFAGSGMKQPLNAIAAEFTEKTKIPVSLDYSGSGRLGGKILLGLIPDLFIPGSEPWALTLKEKGLVSNLLPLAKHTPVIITPPGNNKVTKLEDFTDNSVKLAIGDSDACAIGKNNQSLFERAGIAHEAMNVVASGMSVKQLVQWVESDSVDASIVWRADALQSGQVQVIDIPVSLNRIDNILACMLVDPPHPKEAELFFQFLAAKGPEVFARYGFQIIQE